MFPERDASKVVSAYSREFCNFFFDKLKPIVSSLKFGDLVSKETVSCVGGKVKH